MIDRIVKHYRIIEKIAEGGMGAVYRAEDLRLGRQVALKFLHAAARTSPDLRDRFLQEARAAAQIDHPNICTVLDIDEIDLDDERQMFIVMPLLRGESLQQKLRRGPLPVADAVDLAAQVAQGLARAHAAGIVHRDVKPANLMVEDDGHVKIVDFGVALMTGSPGDTHTTKAVTQAGTSLGTVQYMSPEQARAERVDHRSDIWSLGVVLYQAVTGRLPFDAPAAHATIYAILHDDPVSVLTLAPSAPRELDWIVRKAMAKPPEERYQDVKDLAQDLRALARGGEPNAPRLVATAPREAAPSIAVLPFADMSQTRDQGFFCEGIAEEIISALMQVQGLRVVSRGSSFRFGPQYDVVEVGRTLKVTAVLEGAVRRSGPRLRITAQLTNAADGYQLWSQRFDRENQDIFDIQDEISAAIVKELRGKLVEEQAAPARRGTRNLDAYMLYLQGRYHWNQRTPDAVRKAIEHYRQALALDPDFAPAHCGLADAFLVPGYYGSQPPTSVMPLARASAERAITIDPEIADAHATLGMVASVFDFDWRRGEEHFKRAIELNPNHAMAHSWYALFNLVPQRRFEEAIAMARRAQVLDPLTGVINTTVGACYFFAGQYRRAIEELERTIDLDPNAVIGHYHLGRVYWETERAERAIAHMEKARSLYELPLITGHLGYCRARLGDVHAAQKMLEHLRVQAQTRYVPAASAAAILVGLGESEQAIDSLANAFVHERSSYLIWVGVDPLYQRLRGRERFDELLRQLRLP